MKQCWQFHSEDAGLAKLYTTNADICDYRQTTLQQNGNMQVYNRVLENLNRNAKDVILSIKILLHNDRL